MHGTEAGLATVLVLLASGVAAFLAFRRLGLPPLLGYVLAGAALGPHALGWVPDSPATQRLAEFGVVFLMFSIGLEFSLPRLVVMKRTVFGLGAAATLPCVAVGTAAAPLIGLPWQAGLVAGSVVAMSSTALVSKLLLDRGELDAPHGREAIGICLFQDLLVVPLLIVLPALAAADEKTAAALAIALAKSALVLVAVLVAGPRLMRAWLGVVARVRSTELFVMNVLFIVLGLAWLTSAAGLSSALGAFLAGMLISETEYRYHVEDDIRPFRDVLLGLFFLGVGMLLDPAQIAARAPLVAALLLLIVAGKFALIAGCSRAFGSPPGTAIRTGLTLAQAGEFGLVLLTQARPLGLVDDGLAQALFAAVVLSMIVTPFAVAASGTIALRFARTEWLERSLALHQLAVQSMGRERHVVVLGYGRNGQHLTRLLEAEGVGYVALDLDPVRVREAALAGEPVVYADGARREALVAAGVARAAAVAITFADAPAAARALAHVRALAPSVPVIVRAREEVDIARLDAAGATEVVPEALESGLMLASHTLAWVGVPLARVVRRMRAVREEHYGLLRGLFHGATDEAELLEAGALRLHAVTLEAGASAVGRTLAELGLEALGAEVRAVRRPGAAGRVAPQKAGTLRAGDVVVLLGAPEALAAAETRLLQG